MIFRYSFIALIATSVHLSYAFADDKFANCPDLDAAKKYVKACMQENPYNTREAFEERAVEKFCLRQE